MYALGIDPPIAIQPLDIPQNYARVATDGKSLVRVESNCLPLRMAKIALPSGKQRAVGNFKGGFRFHPLMAWCDNVACQGDGTTVLP
jgi:hypothetical protein